MRLFRCCAAAVVAAEGLLWLKNSSPCFAFLPGNGQVADDCAGSPCGGTAAGTCINTPSGYDCKCEPGYVLGVENDQVTCMMPSGVPMANFIQSSEKPAACSSNPCGPETAGTCKETNSGYICRCNEGYGISLDRTGKVTCIERQESRCEENGCGPPEAVQNCRRLTGTTGRLCVCKENFIATIDASADIRCRRVLPHYRKPPFEFGRRGQPGASEPSKRHRKGKRESREPESDSTEPGRGQKRRTTLEESHQPGGSTPATPQPGESTPATPQPGESTPDSQQSRGGSGSDSTQGEEQGNDRQEGSGHASAIAGGVIGGLLVLSAAGAGVAYMMRKGGSGGGEEVEYERGSEAADSSEVEILVDLDSKTWD
ncbi:UNVERIFIED_CONTAM: microneme protein MIC6 [Hammondia hammondi]|eukprot:XP_008889345.1 microneme protein MIC6 [Hammondia hammondi]